MAGIVVSLLIAAVTLFGMLYPSMWGSPQQDFLRDLTRSLVIGFAGIVAGIFANFLITWWERRHTDDRFTDLLDALVGKERLEDRFKRIENDQSHRIEELERKLKALSDEEQRPQG